MAKVLVVDDDPIMRELLEVRLRMMKHRVISAGSAEEALTVLLERGVPDVAVLDVDMPGSTGLELLSQLRENPAYTKMPAIFLSAQIEENDIAAGRALGATYLTKPVVFSALGSAIDRAVETSSTPQAW